MTQTIQVPSKTFIFGEYSALVDGPALLVTSYPYFEITLEKRRTPLAGGGLLLHSKSPAFRYLSQLSKAEVWDIKEIDFSYPIGGLGQSSAEFVAVYQANQEEPSDIRVQFQNLFKPASGLGLEHSDPQIVPSGYDVIAQNNGMGFTSLFAKKSEYQILLDWPWQDISFFIVATGSKLKTHEHLRSADLQAKGEALLPLAHICYQSWLMQNRVAFLESIRDFRHGLQTLGLESLHTTRLIERFEGLGGYLAAKGCGAMGQDFFILFFDRDQESYFKNKVESYSDLKIISNQLFTGI